MQPSPAVRPIRWWRRALAALTAEEERGLRCALAAAALAVAIIHLIGLATSPPGFYLDEASVGYNAWAIAHHGIDEHGHVFPLFFEDFGDWKGPVATYLLAPFTLVLPLTPWVVRLPGALVGIGTVLLAARVAWELSRSRMVTLIVLCVAGTEPWIFLQSRVSLEGNIDYVFCLMVAVAAIAGGGSAPSPRRFLVTGIALAVSIFAYTPGRVVAAMVTAVILVAYWPRTSTPQRRSLLLPVIAGYLVLLIWAIAHPGALTSRFSTVSVLGDNPGPLAAAARVFANYVQYWGTDFLFTGGDPNPRHGTGYGGVLSVTTLPPLLVGLAGCLRTWREPLSRFLLLGLVLAPVPAALTSGLVANRDAGAIPFLLVTVCLGWAEIWPLLTRQRVAAALLALTFGVLAASYFVDYFGGYRARAALAFQSGLGQAILSAQPAGAEHRLLISRNLEQAYIHVLFWRRVDPRAYVDGGLSSLGVDIVDTRAQVDSARPGDVLILAGSDRPPVAARRVATATASVDDAVYWSGGAVHDEVILDVYQR